jgi:hypothetical protein
MDTSLTSAAIAPEATAFSAVDGNTQEVTAGAAQDDVDYIIGVTQDGIDSLFCAPPPTVL